MGSRAPCRVGIYRMQGVRAKLAKNSLRDMELRQEDGLVVPMLQGHVKCISTLEHSLLGEAPLNWNLVWIIVG